MWLGMSWIPTDSPHLPNATLSPVLPARDLVPESMAVATEGV